VFFWRQYGAEEDTTAAGEDDGQGEDDEGDDEDGQEEEDEHGDVHSHVSSLTGGGHAFD
jgi:hypothetical protein